MKQRVKWSLSTFQNMTYPHGSEYLEIIDSCNGINAINTSWLCRHSVGIGNHSWLLSIEYSVKVTN